MAGDSPPSPVDSPPPPSYNADYMDPEAISLECMTLEHVVKQSRRVLALGVKNQLDHFIVDTSKVPETVAFVAKVVKDTYPKGPSTIPPHSRMRHLENLPKFVRTISKWQCTDLEKTKRILDLVFVSVLVDAGAGPNWKYMADGKVITSSEGLGAASMDMFEDGRKKTEGLGAASMDMFEDGRKKTEGLGAASMDMFEDGLFSSDKAMPHRVNSLALHSLNMKKLEKGLQISDTNYIQSLQGRLGLLTKLGVALDSKPEFFGKEVPRPGNLLDYILSKSNKPGEVSLKDLWQCVAHGLEPIWPKHASGLQTGDIWHHSKLNVPGKPGSDLVSFHKLTQWLLYSVIEVLETHGKLKVNNDGLNMTALAEYRNGGLLVDMGVISLRDASLYEALHSVGSELIVEWRALTVALMEQIAGELNKSMGLNLAQVLEGGTWRAGRIIAKEKRADGGPPIKIRSDGTVF